MQDPNGAGTEKTDNAGPPAGGNPANANAPAQDGEFTFIMGGLGDEYYDGSSYREEDNNKKEGTAGDAATGSGAS